MFFEPIDMIWDTVQKKICNGPMKIGTIFAVHGNFRFYDLMNTLQHLFEIYHNWNLFCLVNGSGSLRLLQAICFFWSQAEYIGIKDMLESVHKVEKTKNSVRYVMVNNIVNIMMSPLQIALSCLLLIEKRQTECSKMCCQKCVSQIISIRSKNISTNFESCILKCTILPFFEGLQTLL